MNRHLIKTKYHAMKSPQIRLLMMLSWNLPETTLFGAILCLKSSSLRKRRQTQCVFLQATLAKRCFSRTEHKYVRLPDVIYLERRKLIPSFFDNQSAYQNRQHQLLITLNFRKRLTLDLAYNNIGNRLNPRN